jgi:aspartate/glutamate racemase
VEPFGREFAEAHPEVEMVHIMDDSLLREALAHQGPTPAVIRRVVHYAMAAEAGGADVIMCSCTTMGPATRAARTFLSVPMFNIDEPMAVEAVAAGQRIGILATVPTSAPATEYLLRAEAEKTGRPIEITTVINEKAFQHLLAGEISAHDAIVAEEIARLADSVDAIALGQISLSQVRCNVRVPVFQVGRSGFAHAAALLGIA